MRNEITAAVLFLVQLIEKSEKFSSDQLDCFQQRLVELLTERFKNHWFPDKPFKGQGYRCIRVNGHNRRDATIESAANAAGVRYEDLSLPVELTLWVDPNEVCCRFGESKGSYCTLASFDDKENIVPLITQHIVKVNKEEKHMIDEAELIVALKRTAESIFDKGGIIRKIDNLGQMQTPYKMSKGLKAANYFIFHFDIAPIKLSNLDDELRRDIDILRWRIYNANKDVKFECTLHEELLPPPYRPEVQKLIESGSKHRTKTDRFKFKFNTGLNYYPFQR